MNEEKLKNLQNIDVVFLSAFDHNQGKDNHGLFEMFKFFTNCVGVNSIYVNTDHSKFSNNENIFNIGHLGAHTGHRCSLFGRISPKTRKAESNLEDSWFKNATNPGDYYHKAAKVFIDVLFESSNSSFFVLIPLSEINGPG